MATDMAANVPDGGAEVPSHAGGCPARPWRPRAVPIKYTPSPQRPRQLVGHTPWPRQEAL